MRKEQMSRIQNFPPRWFSRSLLLQTNSQVRNFNINFKKTSQICWIFGPAFSTVLYLVASQSVDLLKVQATPNQRLSLDIARATVRTCSWSFSTEASLKVEIQAEERLPTGRDWGEFSVESESYVILFPFSSFLHWRFPPTFIKCCHKRKHSPAFAFMKITVGKLLDLPFWIFSCLALQ